MEPDHSASIQFIRQKYPQMTIVGNIKTLEMVKGYYGIDDNTLCIKNRRILVYREKESHISSYADGSLARDNDDLR